MHHTLLVESFQKFENPFVDTHEGLINIVSKEVLSENAAKSVMDAHKIGQEQYSTFMQDKIMNDPPARKSRYCTIKKNKLIPFRSKNAVKTPKSKLQTTTLKERVQLYASHDKLISKISSAMKTMNTLLHCPNTGRSVNQLQRRTS